MTSPEDTWDAYAANMDAIRADGYEAGFAEAKRRAVEVLVLVHSEKVTLEIAPFAKCHCGDAMKAIEEMEP